MFGTASITVEREAPDSLDSSVLVNALERHLAERYPAESRRGYSERQLGCESFGFRKIPPFRPYFDDPVSLCFEAPSTPA